MTVLPFVPTWPVVRCNQCNYLYEIEETGDIITGDCPRCHCAMFDTTIEVSQDFTTLCDPPKAANSHPEPHK